jgi:hypothetical protein
MLPASLFDEAVTAFNESAGKANSLRRHSPVFAIKCRIEFLATLYPCVGGLCQLPTAQLWSFTLNVRNNEGGFRTMKIWWGKSFQ